MARTLAQLQTALDDIDELLASGIESVSVNGRETRYAKDLQLRRAEIQRQINALGSSRPSLRRGRYNPHYDG